MSRRPLRLAVLLPALACASAGGVARAQTTDDATRSEATPAAPAYTLEVETNAPEVISFESVAARIAADLGAPVVRPGPSAPSRAAIVIRYRAGEIAVRAAHAGGRVLERTVKAEGDDAAIQREAVLLASNLARDEAREILDALAARPTPAPKPAPPTAEKVSNEPRPEEGHVPVTVAFFYPLATNAGRPNVGSTFDLSILYGRVGRIEGMQLGAGVGYASRSVDGAQVTGGAAIANGPMTGAQLAGAVSYATGEVTGAQLSGAGNVAEKSFSGAQLTGAFNLARGSVTGAQLSGGANVATQDVSGAQLAPINVGGEIEGLQLGMINVGRRVRGLQLGAINVAEEVDGAAIGLISISKNSLHPIAWTSNLQYMNAGLKFTTKYVFTMAAVHYGTHEGDFDNIGVTGAIGGHIPLPSSFDIEVQGSVTHLVPRPSQKQINGNLWVAPQVVAGYSFASHLRVFAGGGARLPGFVDLGREVVRPEVLAGVQF